MDTADLIARIVRQRQQRYFESIPGIERLGQVPCRPDGPRLHIAFASALPGAAPALVDAVLAYCQRQGLSADWTVIPARAGEAELEAPLRARGLRVEEHQRLLAREGPITGTPSPRVAVVPIDTLDAMMVYEAGSRASFFYDQAPLREAVERRARQRFDEQARGWCRYLAAYLDNRPVGGCYYTRWEEVPTIIGVYTVAQARRNGVATALVTHVIRTLWSGGNHSCCLFVRDGNPAERIYQGLGFVPLLEEYTYSRDAPLPF
ncbi:MAG TPA: GNAT family N-acetyltransferase [Ktedonobacterales bacterium]|nr:GNAT family N-acetyltransferase [Ktedonobacterales bacterium]